MNNNTSSPTEPHWLAPRSHSHLLSAFLVTLNILLVFFLFIYFYKFFWQKPSNQNENEDTNSTISTPPLSPRAGQALEPHFINSLPVIEFKCDGLEKMDCAVCLTDFKDGERIRVLPECNHRFHIDCVGRWFKSNANCPLCRTPVESKDSTALDSVV